MVSLENQTKDERRGAVAVFALVTLLLMIGFASLTVDVGALYNTRADLQNAADSAALAGASKLASDDMLQVRLLKSATSPLVFQTIGERAGEVALHISSLGTKQVVLDVDDVKTGWIDLASATAGLELDHPAYEVNAVHVLAQRSASSTNGPLTFFFASIFGKTSTNVSASATAAFDDRVGGYDPDAGGADLFPITIKDTAYEQELAKNLDGYEYDKGADLVFKNGDGVPEVNLFPLSNTPGNFGLLNVGLGSNGTGGIGQHIANGIPSEDLEKETGEDQLQFYNDEGDCTPTAISGTPGLKASLDAQIQKRVGDVVAVPIHSSAAGSGANTKYNVVGVRFVRIMAVNLNSGSKYLWIQPVSYTGPGLIMNPNAKSTEGAAGQVVLVR